MKYALEIYTPDDDSDMWVMYESNSPFGAMHVGDIIRPVAFDDNVPREMRAAITRIEHSVWDKGQGLNHKTCVYTTAIK